MAQGRKALASEASDVDSQQALVQLPVAWIHPKTNCVLSHLSPQVPAHSALDSEIFPKAADVHVPLEFRPEAFSTLGGVVTCGLLVDRGGER